jgi:SAM-dependent methyltransferase
MTMIRVFEIAHTDNFFEMGYLMANPDVKQTTLEFRHTGRDHYDLHGYREGRRQFTNEFVSSLDRLNKEKYSRFHGLLKSNANFSWIKEPGRFPISSSSKTLSADDYASGESANSGLWDFVLDTQNNPGKNFIDIGCGLRDVIYENCLYVEVYPSICADLIVAPDCRYPLNDCSFDGVSCSAVLEHVTQPWTVIDEIHRILKPGGRCYIDWPFLQPVHGSPNHYYNATREGLRIFFADRFNIESLYSHPAETPEYSLHWLLGRFAAEISDPGLNEQFRKMSVDQLLSHPPSEAAFWKPIVNTLSKSAGEELACGNYLIATKN